MKINIPVYWKSNFQRIQISKLKWAKEILPLLVVIIIAAAVFLLKPGGTGPDVTNYLNTGRRLLYGENYIPSPESADYGKSSVRAPLYSIIFAISFQLFGLSISSALLVPKFATFVSLILIYLLLRRLYDIKTGLAAIALVATNAYMFTFPVSLNIDLVMAFFILLSLLFIVIALDKQSWVLGVVGGTTMGMAVLIKELSLLWLPIIVYLFLETSIWRKRQNFIVVLGYILGSAAVAGSWWIIYYIQTGTIFLLNSVPSSVIKIIQLVLVLIVVLLPILTTIYRFREKVTHRAWFLSAQSFTSRYSFVFGWILWIIITVVITTALSWKTSFHFDSHPDIFLRITNFIDYVKQFILPVHPLFKYFPVAIVIIVASGILKKRHGNNVLLWMFLASMPIILTAHMPNINSLPTRYFFPIYWIAYMILGRGLVIALETVNALLSNVVYYFSKKRLTKLNMADIFLLVLLLYSLRTSWINSSNYVYKLRSTDNYTNDHVVEVSQWLNEHAAPGSNIVTENAFNTGYRFFTNGNFNFYRWDSLNENLGDTKWAVETQVSLERNFQEFQLLSKRDTTYSLAVAHPMYIEYGWDLKELYSQDSSDNYESSIQVGNVPRFFTISEESLVDYLNRYKIDYIILPESTFSHHRFYEKIPSFFNDSPAFEHIYVSQWNEGKERYAIHVYKVNRDRLSVTGYPTTIPANTWTSLENRAQALMGDEYDVIMLNQALGGGPIIIIGATEITSAIYNEIADAYLKHNEFELAAYEYHMGLMTLSNITEDMQKFLSDLTAQYPDYSGAWLLSGDIYYHRGDINLAQKDYERAVAAPYGNDNILSAANAMLGKIHIAGGQYSTAIEYFNAALHKSNFGANEIRQDILFSQANLDLSHGNIEKAIPLFQEFFIGEHSKSNSGPIQAFKYFDFYRQFSQADLSDSSDVHPTVYFMDKNLQLVLYAHPNSNFEYKVIIPANAALYFSPVIAPEVWQFGKGDGVQFNIDLETSDHRKYPIYDAYWDPKNITAQRELITEAISLTRWAGESVTITFTTGCGPNEDCRFDWAGWVEPRILQPVAYSFVEHMSEALVDTLGTVTGQAQVMIQTINYDTRNILYQHPSSRVVFTKTLPAQATLQFGLGMSPEAWTAEKSDGVEYNLYVRTLSDPDVLHRVFHRIVDPKNNPEDRRWFDERVNLNEFGGQTVEIIFEALPGSAGNFDFDWGGWSTPVLIDETPPGTVGSALPVLTSAAP